MANLSKSTVAAFDFDGTLTYSDSLLPFLHFSVGTAHTMKNLIQEIPHFLQYSLGYLNRQGLKEALLARFLKNKSFVEIQEISLAFTNQKLTKMIRPEGIKRLDWHKKRGHRCVLISANLDLYLNPWGKLMSFDDIISSKVEFSSDGYLTGHLAGLNCRGPEKVRRLIETVGPLSDYDLYVYGDSEGDRELLEIATHPFYRTFE